ncbi:MAG: hypothetical protein KDH96_10480 [Candidatus Riesia sp.]|nr:hypothetical protein [Candidatus Riesia sp.]
MGIPKTNYHWVLKCAKCANWGVKATWHDTLEGLELKCKYCNKSTRIKKIGYGLSMKHYGPFPYGDIAARVCQEAKKSDAQGNEKFDYQNYCFVR